VWGAVIFFSPDLELHYGIEPTVLRAAWALVWGRDFLIWSGPPDARHLLATVAPTGAITGVATRGDSPAFSVFFWLQVTNSDLFLNFFSWCHFTFPSYLFCVGLSFAMISRFGYGQRRASSAGHHREKSYMYCWVAALDVLVAALDALLPRSIQDDPAFGVFFWFQVTDFDRFLGFFSLCHFIS